MLNVAIIGGGIAGKSLAYALNKRTVKVSLFYDGASATEAAVGNSGLKGLADPQSRLFELKVRGHHFLKGFLNQLSKDSSVAIPMIFGTKELLEDKSRESWRAFYKKLFHHHFRGLSKIVVQEDGFFFPDDFWFDVDQTLKALDGILAKNGTQFFQEKVRAVDNQEGRWLETSKGRVFFDRIVLAAGAGCLPFFAQFLDTSCFSSVWGETLFFNTTTTGSLLCRQGSLTTVRYEGKGRVGSSALDQTSISLYENNEFDWNVYKKQTREKMMSFVQDEGITHRNVREGLRLRVKDRLPLMGPLKGGLWAYTAFYKNGLQLAPYFSDFLADALTRGVDDRIPRYIHVNRLKKFL